MTDRFSPAHLPTWVPDAAQHYLAHVEQGRSMRELARDAGCHASTVLRQIRRIELRRDDILVELALQRLGPAPASGRNGPPNEETPTMTELHTPPKSSAFPQGEAAPSEENLRGEGLRVLRRLMEHHAVLAVASDMEMAVVVREMPDGTATRIASVDRAIAEAMALKEWISCVTPGRIARYQITAAGRAALMQMMALQESAASRGMAEAAVGFAGLNALPNLAFAEEEESGKRNHRYGPTESPVLGLARRRDKAGLPFLAEDLVRAGERLREDFEMAQVGRPVIVDWEALVWGGAAVPRAGSGPGTEAALSRVLTALRELGPGLGDVVLRCCCKLEGIETVEKQMGWAARSGKVVLKIALGRLKQHYAAWGPEAHLIG